ncbi:MAG: DUF2147 domain-containing protein [Roseiarcus sp.]|jgi:uncharacterized protein (DUF2147 family)|uniref:DUF2147 domain-containing protein n=1 Tax=Roseiarcus sp. TaxID=1969460 RepID=UPI003C3A3B0C
MIGLRAGGAALLFLGGSANAAEPSLLGDWARGDGKALVRFEPCGSAVCAVNTWIKPGTADEKVGDRLVLNVSPSGASVFTGEAFDPQRNMTFRMRMEVGSATMTTRGCVLGGLICKTMDFRRLSAATK